MVILRGNNDLNTVILRAVASSIFTFHFVSDVLFIVFEYRYIGTVSDARNCKITPNLQCFTYRKHGLLYP